MGRPAVLADKFIGNLTENQCGEIRIWLILFNFEDLDLQNMSKCQIVRPDPELSFGEPADFSYLKNEMTPYVLPHSNSHSDTKL